MRNNLRKNMVKMRAFYAISRYNMSINKKEVFYG